MTTSHPIEHPEPVILVVSATDSTGGAGLAVDIRVADHLDHPVRLAVTGLTVQGSNGIRALHLSDPQVLADSIRTAAFDPPGVGAVKVGALLDRETVHLVVNALREIPWGIPVVVDPVLRPTAGGTLLDEEGTRELLRELVPRTTLLTPNRAEWDVLASLLSLPPGDAARAEAVLEMGCGGLLVKGGDQPGDTAEDVLFLTGGPPRHLRHPRIAGPTPRGTGCALSTAIACNLARGEALPEAVEKGVAFVAGLIRASHLVGGVRMLFP